MGYGSRGKYWNVGLGDPGRYPASRQQLWALHLLSGRKEDFRGRGLTRAEASELIRKMGAELDDAKKSTEASAMKDAMFQAMLRKAARAASAAGDEWLEAHPVPIFSVFDPETQEYTPVHGVIGYAYISWPPRRSPFGQWLKKHHHDAQLTEVNIPHAYVGRMERDLLLACEAAALRVLESQGAHGMKLMVREDPYNMVPPMASRGTLQARI